jgi:sn-glycerol 3-phosphate transport system substrate-binding protein
MQRMNRTFSLRVAAFLTAGALVATACSDGNSAIDAGRDDTPAAEPAPAASDPADDAPAVDDTPPATDGAGEPDSDEPEPGDPATSDPAETVTETTVSPLAEYPACTPTALDGVDETVDVTLWIGLAAPLEEALDSLADEFNASQDQVRVSIENQTDYENTIDNYFNLGVGERPELLLAPEFVVQAFAESDTFVPVQACMEATDFATDEFLPRAIEAYSYDGIQWGVPFNVSSPVLFYNKLAFEAAGLDPDSPPLTFDELEATSRQIVDSGAATYGIVVDVGRDSAAGRFEQWFGRSSVPFVDQGNGRDGRATEALFANETGLAILTHLRDMNVEGLSFNVGENAGGVPAFLKIADPQEAGAMTVSTSAAISQVLDALDDGLGNGLTGDDIGVGFLPGPSDQPAAQVGGAALWIPADKGDVASAAAWKFVEFLSLAQSQSTWAAETGYVPIRTDALDLDPIKSLYEDDPRFRVSFDQLAAPVTDPSQTRPALGPQREVRQVIADMIAAVYDDPSADLRQLLDDAESTSNSLIRNYNELN